jgi:hypothetical protein
MADDYAASTATTGVVAVNGSISGTIETSGDADWLAITLTAGHTYQFKSEGPGTGQGSLGNPVLVLHDSVAGGHRASHTPQHPARLIILKPAGMSPAISAPTKSAQQT